MRQHPINPSISSSTASSKANLTLATALTKIRQVFDVDQVLVALDKDVTQQYYRSSERGFRRYHSHAGSIHLAINKDGVFDSNGYYEQPRMVLQHLQQLKARDILEVGCGKGFNSCFLAQNYADGQFQGIDLTAEHLKIAKQHTSSLPNLRFEHGNFNELQFPDNSFDLVFGVECLCHTDDIKQTLQELYRVLRPSGRLIIFDGYRLPHFEQRDPDLQLATQLCEASMAVLNGFAPITDWLQAAKQAGLQLIEQQDLSAFIRPNMLELQQLAKRYFRYPWRAHLFKWFLPKYLIRNAIVGLLFPFINAEAGSTCYCFLVFERPL